MDIDIKTDLGNFKYRVAGVLRNEKEQILIQQIGTNPFWCLAGGHVELGETSIQAIEREMEEELGFDIKVKKGLCLIENIFKNNKGLTAHEIGIYYELLSESAPKKDWEVVENDKGVFKKLKFRWVNRQELEKIDFRPSFLKKALYERRDGFGHFMLKDNNLVEV